METVKVETKKKSYSHLLNQVDFYKNSATVVGMKATILPNEISVEHTSCNGREYLKFSISGWDEVSKLTKKVLLFDGKKFKFSCWNSDDLYCVFIRTYETATISK